MSYVTGLSVEVHDTQPFDLLLQRCQVTFAAARAQVELNLLSGVHGVFQSLVGVPQPFFIQHGGVVKLVDLVQQR